MLQALAFCIGRGPLAEPLNTGHFILTYALPINPQMQGAVSSLSSCLRIYGSARFLHHTRV